MVVVVLVIVVLGVWMFWMLFFSRILATFCNSWQYWHKEEISQIYAEIWTIWQRPPTGQWFCITCAWHTHAHGWGAKPCAQSTYSNIVSVTKPRAEPVHAFFTIKFLAKGKFSKLRKRFVIAENVLVFTKSNRRLRFKPSPVWLVQFICHMTMVPQFDRGLYVLASNKCLKFP